MFSDLPSLLLASHNPVPRKQAEQSLPAQPGFISALLQLVLGQGTQDRSNVTILRWEKDMNPILDSDKVVSRKALVPAMLHLSAPGDNIIRAQVAESVSLISELDFPEGWPDLIGAYDEA
ncbi:hypothetical protein FIBSPDRAFT_898035 [Athelia psychrophila]|uniref:ARM repeat-containing protein n=1 Tax=Athelia psychrophila TaxID=1759441 RepID=A0A166BHW9_9AGAM|nr:hypothetical protein FIBSPDRAFT_898035 [Fibularhizoctonia sp. CBS 109695]